MKSLVIAFASLFLLIGCQKEFSPSLEKARRAFAEKNYIDTIDALNTGMPNWREKDGNEKKAEAFQLLGESYYQLKNFDKAIDAFSEAIKLSDKTYDSAYTLGNLHLIKNEPALARKYFMEALRMKPNDPLTYLGIGNSFYAEKNYDDAAVAYEKVLDFSPGVRDALESLALTKAARSAAAHNAALRQAAKTPAKNNSSLKKSNQRKRR